MVPTSIMVTIMHRPTACTDPYSYPEATQSTRTCALVTVCASDRRARFVDLRVDHAKPHGFVCKHGTELMPASIIDRLGKPGACQPGTRYVANHDQAGTVHQRSGGLVRPIGPTVGDLGMERCHPFLFVGLLCSRKSVGVSAGDIGPGVARAIRAGQGVLQPQVNAYLRRAERHTGIFNLALKVDVPASPRILAEAASLRYSVNRTRQPKPETVRQIFYRGPVNRQKPGLERYPAQRPLPASPLESPCLELSASGDVFPAHLGYRVRVQPKIFGDTSRQIDQVKGTQPTVITLESQHGDFVTVVPDTVDRPCKPLQVLSTRTVFDAVAVCQHATGHGVALVPRCTCVWCQKRRALLSLRNSLEPTDDQTVCACGVLETISGVAERRYL